MLIPLILEQTHVIYLCTRVCVEYPTIYINIEAIQHILIVIHNMHLKRTCILTPKALRQNSHLIIS